MSARGIKSKLEKKFEKQIKKEDEEYLESILETLAVETYNNLIEGRDNQSIPKKYANAYYNYLKMQSSIMGITKISKPKTVTKVFYVEHTNGNILKIEPSMFTSDTDIMIRSLQTTKKNLFDQERAIENIELKENLRIIKR